jgi:hypothetical protein
MQVQAFERRVEELILELAQFSGYRTIWLDPRGLLCHTEPDEELEAEGYGYLATLMRPDREGLTEALAPRIPLELPTPGVGRWRANVGAGFEAQLIGARA